MSTKSTHSLHNIFLFERFVRITDTVYSKFPIIPASASAESFLFPLLSGSSGLYCRVAESQKIMKKSLLIGGQEAVCIKAIYSEQMENGSTAANIN